MIDRCREECRAARISRGGGKALMAALVIGAPLTYGLASCSFAGCHALFGVPLVLDAGFLTLATLGPD